MSTAPASPAPTVPAVSTPGRVVSVDALRGLVMFTMIFVNDLGGPTVPSWMRHFHGPNGMTFVDLVFPAFIFIMGMSIPLAMTMRLAKGELPGTLFGHALLRTLSLLAIGILMVNAEGGISKEMDISGNTWVVLMFTSAIFAFCSISPPGGKAAPPARQKAFRLLTILLRAVGLVGMIWLAVIFRSKNGGRIIAFDPLAIHTSWYGILGLLGWAYLVAAIVFLVFRTNRPPLLACTTLLMGLYAAEKNGAFDGFFLNHIVNIGEALGSHASIATAGVLLGTILLTPDTQTPRSRTRFTLLYILGFSAAALLVHGLWGISKNQATPSWCLWSCAITAGLWLILYFVADVWQCTVISKPLSIAGENVLLAYLLSEMFGSVLHVLGLGGWYGSLNEPSLAWAIGRSAGCAVFILMLSALLNRLGLRLKL